MVGPSLIQHLADSEVSRNEKSEDMISTETKHSAVSRGIAILRILGQCQSSDLRRSADLQRSFLANRRLSGPTWG